jgi:hypothetical protein
MRCASRILNGVPACERAVEPPVRFSLLDAEVMKPPCNVAQSGWSLFPSIADKLREELRGVMAGIVEGRSDDLVSESLPRQSPDEEATVKTPDEAPTPQRKLGKHAQHKQWWQPVVDMNR